MAPIAYQTVAILGGAGRAGQPLAQAALGAGYRVRLLLRHPEKFIAADPRVTVIGGDAREAAALRQLLTGADALLSTLGNPRGEDTPILSAVTAQLLTLFPEVGIRRYLTVTTLYDTDQPPADPPTRLAAEYMQQHFPRFMADRREEYRQLQASDLDWTYVRLPLLVAAPATGVVRASLDHLPGGQLTTPDLANWLLTALRDGAYVRQAPFVANG